jgi:hypothetical protein
MRFDIINYGRSPGWTTRIHLEARPHIERDLENQGIPDYGECGFPNGGIIAPGESAHMQVGDGLDTSNLTISESDKELVYSRDIYLLIYGFVDYRDIHHRPHRSCFGYRLIADAPVDLQQFAILGNDAHWHYT